MVWKDAIGSKKNVINCRYSMKAFKVKRVDYSTLMVFFSYGEPSILYQSSDH